jgi:hypothetical protein
MSTIDQFKSVIGKRGGLAPSNRFAVYMPLPLISIDPQNLIARAFGQGTKQPFINDPRDVSILCDSVTLPGRQIATADLATNILPMKIPYGYINDDVTMTFHITNDHFMKKYFENWFNRMFDRNRMIAKYRSDFVTDVIIQQLDQRNVPVYSISLKNAFPTTITSYELTNSGENQTQKLSITLSYEDWSEEGFVESVLSKGKVLLGSVGRTFGL